MRDLRALMGQRVGVVIRDVLALVDDPQDAFTLTMAAVVAAAGNCTGAYAAMRGDDALAPEPLETAIAVLTATLDQKRKAAARG